MTRLDDWPARLAAYVESRMTTPFQWASHDCWLFAAGAVEATTGVRPEYPAYSSAKEAARLLADRSLSARVDDLFGPRLPVAYAQRGDLVLLVLEGHESIGVCVGAYMAVPSDDGLLMAPREAAVAAWRI